MIQTASGLMYEDIKIGSGLVAIFGQTVAIQYTCFITAAGKDRVKIG